MNKNIIKDKKEVEEFAIADLPEQEDRVVAVDRISRTVKGGRRIRFRALVVVGNRAGSVGIGVAKANDVQTAIAKAKNKANKIKINVPIINDSIAHEVSTVFGTTKVILKPAPQGHSIIAGGSVRAVVELAGIKNIVSKSLGSSNPINSATATFLCLQQLIKSKYGSMKK
ncbi:30S ribosomal protein S5 [Candidatus Berkelbacteria bacterium]|nr:30S ribosomal protein S5 [Candidatus Berkelbacteria bacterium]